MARTKNTPMSFINGVRDFKAICNLSNGAVKYTAKGLADHLGIKETSVVATYAKWTKEGVKNLPAFEEKPKAARMTVAERNAALDRAMAELLAGISRAANEGDEIGDESEVGLDCLLEIVE